MSMEKPDGGESGLAKSAVVAIVGRPSAGKSTFLNAACGEKVSIVSPVPQTTRSPVRGIVSTPSGQLVFIDTPGYHDSDKKFNLKMKSAAAGALSDADMVLYIIDASREPGKEEQLVSALVAPFEKNTAVAVNKTDIPGADPGGVRRFLAEKLPGIPPSRVIDISAREGTHVAEMLAVLYDMAPAGHPLYPEEYYTDQEVDFRIAEIIREKAVNMLREELPHALYVDIADMESRKDGKELWVRAFIVVERESQKGMVIGRGASMIKQIRLSAVKELNEIFPYRIDLDLQVKVHKNWRQKDPLLGKLTGR